MCAVEPGGLVGESGGEDRSGLLERKVEARDVQRHAGELRLRLGTGHGGGLKEHYGSRPQLRQIAPMGARVELHEGDAAFNRQPVQLL